MRFHFAASSAGGAIISMRLRIDAHDDDRRAFPKKRETDMRGRLSIISRLMLIIASAPPVHLESLGDTVRSVAPSAASAVLSDVNRAKASWVPPATNRAAVAHDGVVRPTMGRMSAARARWIASSSRWAVGARPVYDASRSRCPPSGRRRSSALRYDSPIALARLEGGSRVSTASLLQALVVNSARFAAKEAKANATKSGSSRLTVGGYRCASELFPI
jgi:hypothetical protein